DVEDGGADGFVGDVLTIEKNTGGTAGDTANRDSRIASFGRVEGFAALEDNARLDLSEVEEVASVYGKGLNLLLRNNVADAGLLGVDLQGTGIDFDHYGGLAKGEF